MLYRLTTPSSRSITMRRTDHSRDTNVHPYYPYGTSTLEMTDKELISSLYSACLGETKDTQETLTRFVSILLRRATVKQEDGDSDDSGRSDDSHAVHVHPNADEERQTQPQTHYAPQSAMPRAGNNSQSNPSVRFSGLTDDQTEQVQMGTARTAQTFNGLPATRSVPTSFHTSHGSRLPTAPLSGRAPGTSHAPTEQVHTQPSARSQVRSDLSARPSGPPPPWTQQVATANAQAPGQLGWNQQQDIASAIRQNSVDMTNALSRLADQIATLVNPRSSNVTSQIRG